MAGQIRRHKALVIAVVVLVLVAAWLFAIMPLALDHEVGWTGLLVIGDQTGNRATLSCPLTVTDDLELPRFAGHISKPLTGGVPRMPLG